MPHSKIDVWMLAQNAVMNHPGNAMALAPLLFVSCPAGFENLHNVVGWQALHLCLF